MPELFIELFSEEIPARMQEGAAADLERLIAAALAPLSPNRIETFHEPRRIALRAEVSAEVAAASSTERGPRLSAPEQALAGFLRKHGATRDQVRQEGDYWVLDRRAEAVSAHLLIAEAMPPLLRRFPWPKSMRWGNSAFTWVRPLRRIICLLDGAVVPFDLREGDDDAHGLAASNLTEGHRFHAPGAVAVASCAEWQETLAERYVLVDATERRRRIARGIEAEAVARTLTVVDDPGLLDEVAGLVEWPVPLLGRIDPAYMDLPQEVMAVSMRVNQRYFALRTAEGDAAPWFGFVANIEAEDGGATIIAGNERVLRARFADARHFWDLDRRTRLADRVPQLNTITFHAKLGTQGERVRRLRRLARIIAPLVGADPALAERAAELAKADLVTGMVVEFPELQGVMGRYYALHEGEPAEVADAIRDHYAPKGPSDAVPTAPVSIAVALADKLDQLAGFFAVGEKPTGSGDPYALRRAALGVIRIIRDGPFRIRLLDIAEHAIEEVEFTKRAAVARDQQTAIEAARASGITSGVMGSVHLTNPKYVPGTKRQTDETALDIVDFVVERVQVQLRADGARYDVMRSIFAAHWTDDLVEILARTDAVSEFLAGPDGQDLLTAYRRAANILRIESRKDGPHDAPANSDLFRLDEERHLQQALLGVEGDVEASLGNENLDDALTAMASLRAPLDAFFERVTVNAVEPELRRNRLRLLNRVVAAMNRVADFSKIEG